MKRFLLITMTGLTILSFGLVGTGANPALAGATRELKFQSTYPPPHVTVKKAFEPWFKEVGEKSGGALEVVFFPPRAIVKENETFEGAEAGLVDIGTSMCGRNPGKFPLHSIAELPLLFPTAEVASKVIYNSFEEIPELKKEFEGVKMLWQWSSSTAHLLTTKKQVKKMEDLKGLKIIGYTPMMLETIKALGANPLQIPPLDAYLALERGMADGIIMSFAGARSLKLNESCKYAAKADVLTITFYSVMSPITYDGLTADQKKVVDETTGLKMAARCGLALDKGDAAAGQWLKQQGLDIYVIPQSEKARWLKAVQPIYDRLISNLESKGYSSARRVLEATRTMVAQMSK